MNIKEPMGADFSVLDIQFYTNVTSYFRNSVYAFSSSESMNLFKDTGNKLEKQGSVKKIENGQYSGIPLFQCQLKKDSSYILSAESMNYVIYKYIVISNDKKNTDIQLLENRYLKGREHVLVCLNKEHIINIYKVLFADVKNKMAFFSLSKSREYILTFGDETLTMLYKSFKDHVEVNSSNIKNSKWIYNDDCGNVLIDDFYINNNYKLILEDGSVACEFDDTDRSNKWIFHTRREKMGLLRFANYDQPPPFSSNEKIQHHNNDFLTDFNEKVICMTFVLINHQRYKNQ